MSRKHPWAATVVAVKSFSLLLLLCCWSAGWADGTEVAAKTDSGHHGDPHQPLPTFEEGVVVLTPDQRDIAGIEVQPLNYRFLKERVRVPGKVTVSQGTNGLTEDATNRVDAMVPPQILRHYVLGTGADVVAGDSDWQGTIVQHGHATDEVTGMRLMRVALPASDQKLRTGEIVDVMLPFSTVAPVLAVPETALMQSEQGEWGVFVEDQPNRFTYQAVAPDGQFAGKHVIRGVSPGAEVVTDGAFFLAAELAKGGFDPHKH